MSLDADTGTRPVTDTGTRPVTAAMGWVPFEKLAPDWTVEAEAVPRPFDGAEDEPCAVWLRRVGVRVGDWLLKTTCVEPQDWRPHFFAEVAVQIAYVGHPTVVVRLMERTNAPTYMTHPDAVGAARWDRRDSRIWTVYNDAPVGTFLTFWPVPGDDDRPWKRIRMSRAAAFPSASTSTFPPKGARR